MNYGLIGKSLTHSYSKQIHGLLSGPDSYDYKLTPLATDELFCKFMQNADFKGINVTIPYKKAVIPYCKHVSPQAKEVGAVNTILNKGGELHAFNTDYSGFKFMLKRADIDISGKHVMILGTGGTSLTALSVARHSGAKSIAIVSRSARKNSDNAQIAPKKCPVKYLTYEQAEREEQVQIIINTTPVGMYPNNDSTPIDLTKKCANTFILPNLLAAVDVIYNPTETRFLHSAKQRGLKCTGGLSMLVAQAKYAAEIFTGKEICDDKINEVIKLMGANMTNIVLIGMPGCGKTHIGKLLAQRLNRQFVDMDELIVQKVGCSIAQLFKTKGETYFRKIESEICAEVSRGSSLVISTGGGVILNCDNVRNLHQNGTVFYIDRELEKLQTGKGRPLSKSAADVENLYNNRHKLYIAAADITINNNGTVQEAVIKTQEAFYENTNY